MLLDSDNGKTSGHTSSSSNGMGTNSASTSDGNANRNEDSKTPDNTFNTADMNVTNTIGNSFMTTGPSTQNSNDGSRDIISGLKNINSNSQGQSQGTVQGGLTNSMSMNQDWMKTLPTGTL